MHKAIEEFLATCSRSKKNLSMLRPDAEQDLNQQAEAKSRQHLDLKGEGRLPFLGGSVAGWNCSDGVHVCHLG